MFVSTDDALLAASRAEPKDRTRRMRALRKQVTENDVAHWADSFLTDLSEKPSPRR